MSRRTRNLLLALAAALALGAVVTHRLRAPRSTPAAPVAAEPGLRLAPADVVVADVVELAQTVPVSGGLKAVRSATVKARVAGELLALTVREGDVVRAGQEIGRIDATESSARLRQAEQNVAAAAAQLEIADRTLNNNRALVEQNFISTNALETSMAHSAAARANVEAARSAAAAVRKGVDDAQLRAPIDGIVSQRLLQPGERAGIDARIVEIVDLARLELEAAVPPDDVVRLRVGQPATLEVDGLTEPVSARVARISPSTQAGTRAVLAYLELAPRTGLRQGLYARGQVETGRRRTLAVPLSLVRTDQAEPYLLTVVDGRVRRQTVRLGERGFARDSGTSRNVERAQSDAPVAMVEITSGLAAGATLLRGRVGTPRDGTPATLTPPGPDAARAARAAGTGTVAATSTSTSTSTVTTTTTADRTGPSRPAPAAAGDAR